MSEFFQSVMNGKYVCSPNTCIYVIDKKTGKEYCNFCTKERN